MESTLERRGPATDPDWIAGARAKGEFRWRDCGYGVTVYRSLPACPMCQGVDWERVPWRPYTRVVYPCTCRGEAGRPPTGPGYWLHRPCPEE